jgi:predicted HNH restriction endonuclease
MAPRDWQALFRADDIIFTQKRRSPFRILEIADEYIRVQAPARETGRVVDLDYRHLDVLFASRKVVDLTNINDSVNEIWKSGGEPHDWQNESQYWATVCERQRLQELPNTDLAYTEGGRVLMALSRYERSPKLRAACLKKHKAKCCVCGLDFKKRYGDIGDGFIHVHHLRPLAQVAAEHEVSVDDLVPVCPNCHAMLHQQSPPYTPKELRGLMKAAKAKE